MQWFSRRVWSSWAVGVGYTGESSPEFSCGFGYTPSHHHRLTLDDLTRGNIDDQQVLAMVTGPWYQLLISSMAGPTVSSLAWKWVATPSLDWSDQNVAEGFFAEYAGLLNVLRSLQSLIPAGISWLETQFFDAQTIRRHNHLVNQHIHSFCQTDHVIVRLGVASEYHR